MEDVFQYIDPSLRNTRFDIYDPISKTGIHSNPVAFQEEGEEIDLVIPVHKQYVKHVEIGDYVICEQVQTWVEPIQAANQNVFLYTGNAWIWLVDRQTYTIESEETKRNVWIGELCTFQTVFDNTCLKTVMSEEGQSKFLNAEESIDSIQIAYARCEPSMYFLDDIHRNYVQDHKFKEGDIVAVQSVAGSGKTTTLLNLAKRHKSKRILYIAFNKSLVQEIKQKVNKEKLPNLDPMTFDSLLYKMYSKVKKDDPTITTLTPNNLSNYVPCMKGKYYRAKQKTIEQFNKFCNDPEFNVITDYCVAKLGKRKPVLQELWKICREGAFHTFETIRKQAQTEHWFKNIVDQAYDMIMIDETQDFDMNMLRMLLDDTRIPKLFVGDPKQSIYEFRGCINAFLYLPRETLRIEFYSTFRVGNPACSMIRKQFSNLWLISKSKHETILEPYSKWLGTTYTYIFRSWRCLLQTAFTMKNIWIQNFEAKAEEIRRLHAKLVFTFSLEDEFEDDLPKFLKSITTYELDTLLETIEANQVNKDKALVKFYTIHAYKGLEDDIVRLADDVDKSEETLYYVALTRGRTRILTPNDIEYFEKLIAEPKPSPNILVKQSCVCGGCTNRDHTICIYDTGMGKKKWCIDCSKQPCTCF